MKMSFRNLIDGECGAVNPIVGFSRHYTNDKAFQERTGIGSIPSSANQSSDSKSFPETEAQQLVNEFINDSQHDTNEGQPFRMDALLEEVTQLENVSLPADPFSDQSEQWTQQFSADQELNNSLLGNDTNNRFESEWNHTKWAEEYLTQSHQQLALNDDQWTDELATNESLLATEANKLIESIDGSLDETDFVKFIKKIGNSEITITDGNVVQTNADKWSEEFAQTSHQISQDWSKEFVNAQKDKEEEYEDDSAFWSKLAKDWKEMGLVEDISEGDVEHPWLSDYNKMVEPFKDDYKFNEENPLREHPDPFQEGLNKLKEGDIPSAVLLFEASVQKEPNSAKSWQYLGTSQAENEHDSAAIAALKKCLELEPNNLTALMALAVSYTNESMQTQACATLKRWIKNNPKYQSLLPEENNASQHKTEAFNYGSAYGLSSIITSGQHQEVKDLFIEAARQSPNDLDADVQCGLGVLFNLSGEYDKAADCFQSALQVRPNDSSLWNRLGATLANGSQSEEAINAYREALALSPGFIRSRFNLGISCINLGAYREAAEHFLTVLNIQAAGRGLVGSRPLMSANIWSTLRMVMTLMNRTDLLPAVDERDLTKLNNEFQMSDEKT
jgi:peroxin-5